MRQQEDAITISVAGLVPGLNKDEWRFPASENINRQESIL